MASPWASWQMRSQPRLPFPGRRVSGNATFDDRGTTSLPDLLGSLTDSSQKEDIYKHLDKIVTSFPQIFEEYIVDNVRTETITKWLTKSKSSEENRHLPSKSLGDLPDSPIIRITDNKKLGTHAEMTAKQDDFLEKIDSSQYLMPIHTLCSHLKDVTMSSGFSFYAVGGMYGDTLHLYNPDLPQWKKEPNQKQRTSISPSYVIGKNSSVAAHVASTKEMVVVGDIRLDERFPNGTATQDSASAFSVLGLPFLLPSGDLLGVVEIYRTWDAASYTDDVVSLALNILRWAEIAIHKSQVSTGLRQQAEMSNFLLEVSKTYLDDLTNIDIIIKHIMRFAKTLVSADRCSFFLIDKEKNELFTNLFDQGSGKDGEPVFTKQNEIRIPMSTGIAGHAATTKQILNVPDAYADKRFNRDVDKQTGYTTRNVLCIPILGDGEVYGVVEMINKKDNGPFTAMDQNNFQMFTVFCALALRYSKIHATLERNEWNVEIVKEQYRYHSRYLDRDYRAVVENFDCETPVRLPDEYSKFEFSLMSYDAELPIFFINMANEITNSNEKRIFPLDTMSRFILNVRKNYRDLPYHNWHHAMTVAHVMYCMLVRNQDLFTVVEKYALLVACVCHDLDHRANSNQFLQKTNHPLSLLYPNSTMEYHHIATTLDMIGRENCDILCGLSDADRKHAMYIIKEAIIATDLALYFGNRGQIEDSMDKGDFNFDDPLHRVNAMGLMMSASDISSTAKAWEVTESNVIDLHQEFWAEGDRRKHLGLSVIPMMDRDLSEDLAAGQVGFYSNVSIKCFETLVRILPSCHPLVTGAKDNLGRWREEAEKMEGVKEERKRLIEDKLKRERMMEQEGAELTLRAGMWEVGKSRETVNEG